MVLLRFQKHKKKDPTEIRKGPSLCQRPAVPLYKEVWRLRHYYNRYSLCQTHQIGI